jgi:hypothetical protein
MQSGPYIYAGFASHWYVEWSFIESSAEVLMFGVPVCNTTSPVGSLAGMGQPARLSRSSQLRAGRRTRREVVYG